MRSPSAPVHPARMSLDIRAVMRNGAEGERIFVQIARFLEQRRKKIRASDIMHQVAEEAAPERIVSEVLNDAATVGVTMRDLEFRFSGVWKALEQDRLDGVVPEAIHQGLVRQHRVGLASFGTGKQEQ